MLKETRKKQPGILRRRRFARAQVEIPSSYSIIEQDCIRQGSARIVDLSSSGVRMTSATEFVQGSQVALRFVVPNEQREMYVNGRIVMSFFDGTNQRYRHGVAFTRISRADQDAIRQYVDDVASAKKRFARLPQATGNTIRGST